MGTDNDPALCDGVEGECELCDDLDWFKVPLYEVLSLLTDVFKLSTWSGCKTAVSHSAVQ